MKAFFAPAKLIMGKMRFPIKFTTIFIIVLVPLVFLSYNMVSILAKEIKFLENEKTGVTSLIYNRPDCLCNISNNTVV